MATHPHGFDGYDGETHILVDDGTIPNNDRLPLLVYPGVVDVGGDDPPSAFERLFRSHGWGGTWRDGVYPYHHYHAEAHEVLGIAVGSVTVLFGGEGGVTVTATAGDVVVIPAGVGHKRLAMSADLCVVGAYPRGQSPDLRREGTSDRVHALDVIPRVPLPTADHVHGVEGPLMGYWAPPCEDGVVGE